MTKRIRIENADTSDWKVTVEVWNKGQDGQPDIKISEKEINNPTELGEFYIWKEQYLIVKERSVYS